MLAGLAGAAALHSDPAAAAPSHPDPAGQTPDNRACLACHATPGMQTTLSSGETLYLTVDEEVYNASVHGRIGYACVQCHTDISGYPHPALTAATRRDLTLQLYRSCAACHPSMFQATLDSVHQVALGGRQHGGGGLHRLSRRPRRPASSRAEKPNPANL